ncbi:hypothetical protein RB195_023137 [Necator americanus]|uniref:Reverse transcriptase domain-containing protein n=1 Tax=Necator americanus TaxID=51031 RepID=A0ABR1EI03_NECAM
MDISQLQRSMNPHDTAFSSPPHQTYWKGSTTWRYYIAEAVQCCNALDNEVIFLGRKSIRVDRIFFSNLHFADDIVLFLIDTDEAETKKLNEAGKRIGFRIKVHEERLPRGRRSTTCRLPNRRNVVVRIPRSFYEYGKRLKEELNRRMSSVGCIRTRQENCEPTHRPRSPCPSL